MEGRVWAMLAAFLFIACFAGVVSYYFEIDSKQRELANARADLKAIENGLVARQSQAAAARLSFEKAKEQLNKASSERATLEKLEVSKKELTQAIADLRSKKTFAVGEFKKSVDKVRGTSIGMAWPEFTNGSQTLRGARIQKVGDAEVTFAHDEGVAKIGQDDLPADLRKRFRIGMFPMLPEPPPAPADGAQPSATLAGNMAAAPIPEGSVVYKSPAELAKLQGEINAYEEKIASLTTVRSEWQTRASNYRSQANTANVAGRPTYTFNQQAKQAEQNADAARVQIEQIRAEIRKLRNKQAEPASVAR